MKHASMRRATAATEDTRRETIINLANRMADDPATKRTTHSKLNTENKNECAEHVQCSMFM